MLRNCTFGRYIQENSTVHQIDPRIKILFCFFYSVLIFFVSNFLSLFLFSIFIIFSMILSKIKISVYLRNVKLILPILILTCISNLVFVSSKDVFVKIFCFYLPKNYTINCLFIVFRMISLVILSSTVSFTTTPLNLTKALESLLRPLKYIKVPVEDLAMIVTLTLRFVPLVIEQTNKIIDAQKIRGADFNNKNIIKRIKSYSYIIVPVLTSLLRRIDDLVTAMESRCYTGKNRTHLRKLKLKKVDAWAALFLTIILILVLILR